MQRVEVWLRLTMAGVVLLSSFLLANALNNATLGMIALAGITFSLLATDFWKLFQLERFLANLGLLLVAGYSVMRFFDTPNDGMAKLGAVGDLLVYLQVILLFQSKTTRIYWHIWVLSLLQVVVACALSLAFEMSGLLLGYMSLSIITIAFIAIFRDSDVARNETKSIRKKMDQTRNAQRQKTGAQVIAMQQRQSPVAFFDRTNISRAWIRGMLLRVILLTAVGIFFALVVFHSAPRENAAWYGPNFSRLNSVGFSPMIQFGKRGLISPSNKQVMRVSMTDDRGKPYMPTFEPYFRGITLKKYQKNKDGVYEWMWVTSPADTSNAKKKLLSTKAVIDSGAHPEFKNLKRIIQKVNMQPTKEPTVFSMFPAFRIPTTPKDLAFNYSNENLIRTSASDETSKGPFIYELDVPLYLNGDQFNAIPYVDEMGNSNKYRIMLDGGRMRQNTVKPLDGVELGYASAIVKSDLPTLVQKAIDLKANCIDPTNRKMIAFTLNEYLRDSDEFKYTLDFRKVEFDETIDPIEDFFANHKSGHCEYFASALALMLRAVDIPSRVVVGYKGGEPNSVGDFLEIRERDAHAWVECYLRPEDCDEDMRSTGQAGVGGAWYRLDPTPASIEGFASNEENLVNQAGDAIGYAQMLWEDYVLGLDRKKQSIGLFEPNRRILQSNLSLFQNQSVKDLFSGFSQEGGSGAFFFRLGCAGMLVVFMTYYSDRIGTFFGLFRSRLKGVAQVATAVNARPIEIGFYRDMMSVLEDKGLKPARGQTQLEFAQAASAKIGSFSLIEGAEATEIEAADPYAPKTQVDSGNPAPLIQESQDLIQSMTDRFLEIRFGARELKSADQESLGKQVSRLKSVMSKLTFSRTTPKTA